MAKPVLILINGIPGTGKTTLSRKLAQDLGLPYIGKDDIKELLYERMGVKDVQWSKDLGAAAAEMLFGLVERLAERKWSFIVESAFFYSFAQPRIGALLEVRDMDFVEVYCKTDGEVRRIRIQERSQNGERHPGHLDHHLVEQSEEEIFRVYAPLKVGKMIEYGTTEFSQASYGALLDELKIMLQKQEGV